MNVIWSLAFVVALALPGGSPAIAQGEDGNRVRKTFTLTLYGDFPANEDFSVFISRSDPTPSGAAQMPYAVLLCDPSITHCQSGGAVYTAFLTAQPDTKISYTFAHNGEVPRADGSKSEYFGPFHETLTADSTTSVAYTYGEDGEPQGFTLVSRGGQDGVDPDMPSELPETGAGGGGRNPVLPTGAAIGLALLAASGFAVRRRYRAR